MTLGPRQLELITALRSGRYQQTKGALRRGDCFCVEGVACDVSGVGKWDDSFYVVAGERCCSAMLPQAENYFEFRITLSLLDLNDKEGLSFAEIADRIEAKPQDFFYREA
jgi:hypothetical protein